MAARISPARHFGQNYISSHSLSPWKRKQVNNTDVFGKNQLLQDPQHKNVVQRFKNVKLGPPRITYAQEHLLGKLLNPEV